MLTADPDADLEHALVEWRKFRRRKRLADVHWVDALYQTYLTAIIGSVLIVVLAGLVGDKRLDVYALSDFRPEADDWLGVFTAFAVAIGLRSGSRGGPLALERAEVRHVLLAPVDRTTALRAPALRQLRFLLFGAVIAGAIAGELASKRLPESGAAWVVCGALFAATTIALAYGVALCTSALRVPRWAASLAGLVLVCWAVLDGLNYVDFSPATAVGRIGLWPFGVDLLGIIGMVASVAVLVVGLLLVGDASVEAAERRSTLVGQLRFAATLQDVRTVIVLRRQLAMELPRIRPWVRRRRTGPARFPVWNRGVRGVLRWPAARVARLLLLGSIAGFAMHLVWLGTTPAALVAAIALLIAGLDAVEALAQEVDHPSRQESVPVPSGALHLRQLPVAIVVMVLVATVGAIVGVLVEPSMLAVRVAAICIVPAAVAAVAGGAISTMSGAPSIGGSWSLLPPEIAGARLVARTAWPPLLAATGTLPVLAAKVGYDHGGHATTAALAAAGGVIALSTLVFGWIRVREDVHAWWRRQMDAAFPDKDDDKAGGADKADTADKDEEPASA
ncbi:MAG: hypothetical protein QOF97_602 [Acidimicrobiaceae bacterium]